KPIVYQVCFTGKECKDDDKNCYDWILSDRSLCKTVDYIVRSCKKSCNSCEFDVKYLPFNLRPLAWLVGKWRSEHGGKAIFPTIPTFTYGEQIEFSIPSMNMKAIKALNYTAFAWGINDMNELHSEYGYITMKPRTNIASLTTVMDNGFVTIEEGPVRNNKVELRLYNIGRISFSRDLPVHNLLREWALVDSRTLKSRLDMETLTHPMQEHTSIVYKKIYP
ncbi:unnamed protein product, partial [Enterobius vermicularis]|uniref:ShKT domain-containing protein n=1 Tax=Enterobius vermicularis TaxID=51028 RepID=A0A0N4V544_ENTVE